MDQVERFGKLSQTNAEEHTSELSGMPSSIWVQLSYDKVLSASPQVF